MKQLAALAAGLCLLAFSPTPTMAAPSDAGWSKFIADRQFGPSARSPQPSFDFPELWLLDQRHSGKGSDRYSDVNTSCAAGPYVGDASGLVQERG